MSSIVAFADEYGNNSFEFETQGSHFIVASVILNKDKLKEASAQIEQIRIRHFQKGEIKSKKVANNHMPTLFSGSDFSFGISQDNSMIQLADFIAGTLARCFDETKKSEESDRFFQLLKPKITSLNHFPPDHRSYYIEAAKGESAFDPEIATAGFNSANLFLGKQKVETKEDTDKINCVKLLLLYFNNYGVHKYITTSELIRHLNVGRPEVLTEHTFRTKVIGQIRDAGVLVVSSSTGSNKGYKLPSSVEDLHKFVNHGNSMILPMLHRIKIIRDKIKLATLNQTDIVAKGEFDELRTLLDILK
jgi:hypothetical protein